MAALSHGAPPISPQSPAPEERRGFLVKCLAILIGGVIGLVPLLSGIYVFLDPLRRKSSGGRWLRVTNAEAVPSDGVPRRFPVLADKSDAWNHFPAEPIGAVYLLRDAKTPERVTAFNVLCPHAGCGIDFSPQGDYFQCPCHTSAFALTGEKIKGPSPRGLDSLEAKLETQQGVQEIWVKFEDFYPARATKVPKA